MANLLALSLELRFQIYLDTLIPQQDQPPTERQILNEDPISSLWEFSFPPALLFVNQQIYAEVKHIFYGKNTWTMTASMQRTHSTLPPTAAVPYLRSAHLKIHLDRNGRGASDRSFVERTVRDRIDQNCLLLYNVSALQTLQISCAETRSLPKYLMDNYYVVSPSAICCYLSRHPEMRESIDECLWDYLASDQALVSKLLQPLLNLPGTLRVLKGEIYVDIPDVMRARITERAFSNCVDAVIALRRSS